MKLVICVAMNVLIQFKMKGALQMFAIANDNTIGEAPECLTSMNPVELGLISKARTDRHIFQYYGGTHQSMSEGGIHFIHLI